MGRDLLNLGVVPSRSARGSPGILSSTRKASSLAATSRGTRTPPRGGPARAKSSATGALPPRVPAPHGRLANDGLHDERAGAEDRRDDDALDGAPHTAWGLPKLREEDGCLLDRDAGLGAMHGMKQWHGAVARSEAEVGLEAIADPRHRQVRCRG